MVIRFLFCLFLVGVVMQTFFFDLERVIYVNEIYCLAGFVLLLRRLPSYIDKPQNMVLQMVLFLIVYGLVYAVYSYFYLRQGTTYEFLRTLPLWYSIPAFFLGVEFVRKNARFLLKLGKLMRKSVVLVASAFFWVGPGPIAYSSASFALLMGEMRVILFSVLLYYAYAWMYLAGKATSPMALIAFLMVLLSLRSRLLQKQVLLNAKLHTLFFLMAVIVLHWVYFRFPGFYKVGVGYFGHGVDDNAAWRLMFWAYGVVHNFLPHPLLGIGFGTPIFNPIDPKAYFIIHGNPRDPHLAYTLGMHNSYLTVLSRLGVAGFIPLMAINHYLFKLIYKYRLLKQPLVLALFVTYTLMAVMALFHVIMESPLYSGEYWIFCGMLYGAIRLYIPYSVVDEPGTYGKQALAQP